MTLDQWVEEARWFDHAGHSIAYWTAGEGRPLLLIHGYPTASYDWNRVWPTLAKRRRLVACDLLGFGLSDKPSSGYSLLKQTDLQESLLASLGISEYDALVHDYGVSIGQELLARQLEGSGARGLGRMAFLNGGLFPEQHRPVFLQRLGVSPLGFVVGRLMNRQRFGKSFSAVFGKDTQPSPEELDDRWRLISTNNGHRIVHKLLHYIEERREHRERWVSVLQKTTLPLKLINGGADPVSGRHLYDYFREMVPGAEAVCFPEIGHYPHTEAPEQVLDALNDFFA